MDPTTRLDGTSMLTEEPPIATAGRALGADNTTDTVQNTDNVPNPTDPAPNTTTDNAPNPTVTVPNNTTTTNKLSRRFELDKSKIIDNIQYFCNPENFRDDSDDENTTVPENDPNGDFMETSEVESGEERRTTLYRFEILQLIEALSTSNDPKEGFVDLVRRNIPSGVELSPRRLAALLHPDRFPDEDAKIKAHDAFTSESFGYHGRKINPNMEDYHLESYKLATQHLIKLYEAFQRGEEVRMQYTTKLSETVMAAHSSLTKINDDIQAMNEKKQNPKLWGTIEVAKLISGWTFKRDSNDEAPLYETCEICYYPSGWRYQPPREEYDYGHCRGKVDIMDNFQPKLEEFYKSLSTKKYDEKRRDETADKILRLQLAFEDTLATANRSRNQPETLNLTDLTKILPMYCGLKRHKAVFRDDCVREIEDELYKELDRQRLPHKWSPFHRHGWEPFVNWPHTLKGSNAPGVPATSTVPDQAHTTETTKVAAAQSELTQTKLLTNGKVILNIPKLSVTKTFRPGYTTSGDRIIALQRRGMWSANFVVETNGLYRIMSYGSAGGKPVLEAAKDAKIPFTRNNVALLEEKIKQGGGYQILFVALGEWNLDKTTANGNPQLPLVIAGLGFIKPEIQQEYVSRSTLGALIGNSAAQHEISSAMGGDGDEDILSTMLSKLDIADIESKPHLMRYQNQRNQRLLTYPGPSMTMNAPINATAWQNMQAPNNFQYQGLQQGFQGYQQPQQGFQGYQQPQQGFQGYQQPQQGFQGYQQPQQRFGGYQQPQQGFQGYQQPQQRFGGYQQPQQGFQGYQQPQQGFQGYQQPQQGFQDYQQPQQGYQQSPQAKHPVPSQETELLNEWSDLSRSLMEPTADLENFSNILKSKVPAIIQYLKQTEDGIRRLDEKRFQLFQSYNNKEKQKEVIQEWSRNVQSAPSSLEVGHVLAELHTYAERLGSLQD
ncbi:hypothetical protein EIK77_005424 [Talaromyces pinophilus]|nr:hypothetical protein EIK77_005424 [Talaromyces pinophilus]